MRFRSCCILLDIILTTVTDEVVEAAGTLGPGHSNMIFKSGGKIKFCLFFFSPDPVKLLTCPSNNLTDV